MSVFSSQIDKCIEIAREYGAKKLVLFGSVLDKPDSARDLDFLCDGVEGWKLYEMSAKMEEETGIPVDVIPANPKSQFIEYNLKKGKEVLAA